MRTRNEGRLFSMLAAGILLAAYGVFLLRNTSFSVGGSDSSGYINIAKRLVAGTLVSRPRTLERYALADDLTQSFIPLGFVPGPRPGTMAPYYPSGFPAHMAGAAMLVGWRRGPFLVSPLAAVGSVLLFYLLARALSLSRAWGLAGSAIFATWPVLIGQAIQPMSDATATFWSLGAVLCGVLARRRRAWALGSGACLGIAVLVRPTSLLLVLPLAFALPMSVIALTLFIGGGLPFAGALAAYDVHCYGSALQSGYGKTGLLGAVAPANFPPRFRHYGLWVLRTLTPATPLAWLGLWLDRRVSWRDRALPLSWFGVFFLFYCLYEPYDSFWFVRFLLPASPGLILGALLVARDLATRPAGGPRWSAAVATSLLVLVLIVEVRATRAAGVLLTAESESVYPQICAWAARTLPARSVVMSMAASGALEHYTDLAYARWDWIDSAGLAALRPVIENRGGRWFALLFPFEADEMGKRMAGHWRKIGSLRDVGLWKLEDGP